MSVVYYIMNVCIEANVAEISHTNDLVPRSGLTNTPIWTYQIYKFSVLNTNTPQPPLHTLSIYSLV